MGEVISVDFGGPHKRGGRLKRPSATVATLLPEAADAETTDEWLRGRYEIIASKLGLPADLRPARVVTSQTEANAFEPVNREGVKVAGELGLAATRQLEPYLVKCEEADLGIDPSLVLYGLYFGVKDILAALYDTDSVFRNNALEVFYTETPHRDRETGISRLFARAAGGLAAAATLKANAHADFYDFNRQQFITTASGTVENAFWMALAQPLDKIYNQVLFGGRLEAHTPHIERYT